VASYFGFRECLQQKQQMDRKNIKVSVLDFNKIPITSRYERCSAAGKLLKD
jgi:hypothetical protein